MLTWRLCVLAVSAFCLLGGGGGGCGMAQASEVVECDIGEDLGMALDDVFAPSLTLATLFTVTTKEDCYRECCDASECNAVSFGIVRDDPQCILMQCTPFDTCTWKPLAGWSSGRVNRTVEYTSTSSTSSSTSTSNTPSTPSASLTGASSESSSLNDSTSSNDSSNSSSSNFSPSPTSSDDDDWFALTTVALNADQKEALEEEEEQWDDLWDEIWDEQNGVEDGGGPTTDRDGGGGGGEGFYDGDGDFHKPDSTTDSHRFDSAYLGSFSDTTLDSPALIIGATATVLFAVVVLICVGLKYSNRQRSKYRRLRDDEAAIGVNAPLTGSGYETYD